jgi:hypothetical protein
MADVRAMAAAGRISGDEVRRQLELVESTLHRYLVEDPASFWRVLDATFPLERRY